MIKTTRIEVLLLVLVVRRGGDALKPVGLIGALNQSREIVYNDDTVK